MKIITIIPLQKGAFIEDLTYFTAKDIYPGTMVLVPLRNKKILGLVISAEEVADTKGDIKNMSFDLRKVTETKGRSIFREEFLESVFLCSKYFASKKNDAITSLIPTVLREEYDKISAVVSKDTRSLGEENNKEEVKTKKEIRAEKLVLQLPLFERISIYKTLIRESFALKKSIFIVLPNDRDVKNFKELLSKGIENFTFAIHPGYNSKKTVEIFSNIITSLHPVLILGTPQFLSIPRNDIGVIILENESTSGYKMLSRPYFDLRVFAEIFASHIGARFIYADTLLRFETIGRMALDNINELYPLSFRTNFEGEIEISGKSLSVAGLRPGEKGFQVFRDKNIEEIQGSVLRQKNVFIFSLRKGLATITVCKDCNEFLMCKNCGAPVVLYLSRDGTHRMFVCNRCKEQIATDTICQKCGSWNLLPLGIGTDRVFEEIEKFFYTDSTEKKEKIIKIFKLDKESAKSKSGAEKIVKDFEEETGTILIGTEMALFYLTNKVPLSVIASFDSLASIPSFKMNERIIHLIFSIISKTENKIIIQTKNEQDLALQAIKTENLLSFVREDLEDRKHLGYPPYNRFIKVTYQGDKKETSDAKEMLGDLFKEYNPEIFSGFIGKLKGKYVTNLLVRIETKNWSLPQISLLSSIDEKLLAKLVSLPKAYSVNIDPEDLL